jgi:hypothetical protein
MSEVTNPVITEKKPEVLKKDLTDVPELMPVAEQKKGNPEEQKTKVVVEAETEKKKEEAKVV